MARPTDDHQLHEHEPGGYHWCVPGPDGCEAIQPIPERHFCLVAPGGRILAISTVRYSQHLEVEGGTSLHATDVPGARDHEMPDLPDRLRLLDVTQHELVDHFLHDDRTGAFVEDPARPRRAKGG